MPGGKKATSTGVQLRRRVAKLVADLGLEAREEVRVGRRLWGSVRHIDVVATDIENRRSIGLECKYQGTPGTAEEKGPALVRDIEAWPIPGLVVFDGEGFSSNMKIYLDSTGKAVRYDDLEDWLRLFFGLPSGEDDATRRGRVKAGRPKARSHAEDGRRAGPSLAENAGPVPPSPANDGEKAPRPPLEDGPTLWDSPVR